VSLKPSSANYDDKRGDFSLATTPPAHRSKVAPSRSRTRQSDFGLPGA